MKRRRARNGKSENEVRDSACQTHAGIILLRHARSVFLAPLAVSILLLSSAGSAFSQSRLELGSRLLDGVNGNVLSEPQIPGRKSPALAAFASFAIPGLGEMYAGK